LTNKKVLWAKNEKTAGCIASMTKMMTVYLMMKDLKKPGSQLTMETVVPATPEACKVGGHQIYMDPKETFTLEELLKCVMIRSANDCAYLLAEFLGGSEQAFVQVMSSRAKELGCQNFVFHNAHGLPTGNQENMGTPLEIAYLSSILLDIPAITRWSSVRHDTIRENTKPFNLDSTNHLLGTCPGVNGMKTGFTNKAGYCLCATCERNSRRVVVVILGCEKGTIRDNIARQLIDWVYTL
jgi:D-alanyl-D-alanine carboxypeptidase (penicillin-binding protein 5/6)